MLQDEFNATIGELDHILSKLVHLGKNSKDVTVYNIQTLKHHAEDMIAAGEKILKDIGGKNA